MSGDQQGVTDHIKVTGYMYVLHDCLGWKGHNVIVYSGVHFAFK